MLKGVMNMSSKREYCEAALVGGVGYCLLEMVWRGRTHWSMALAGGVCFAAEHAINRQFAHAPLWRRCLMGAAVITAVELAAGRLFNRRYQVWDYRGRRGNLDGQICLAYSGLWFLLCVPLCSVSGAIRKKTLAIGPRVVLK